MACVSPRFVGCTDTNAVNPPLALVVVVVVLAHTDHTNVMSLHAWAGVVVVVILCLVGGMDAYVRSACHHDHHTNAIHAAALGVHLQWLRDVNGAFADLQTTAMVYDGSMAC